MTPTELTERPLFAQAKTYDTRTAIVDSEGEYSYHALREASGRIATALLNGKPDLAETRVAFLTPRRFPYVAVQWGIWRAGGIAVPLCEAHPQPELAYVIDDSAADIVIAHPEFETQLRPIVEARPAHFLLTSTLLAPTDTPIAPLPSLEPNRRAMILYTSGTTGRPKGAVTTHANIEAQVRALTEAWGWQSDDHILNVLPLHHTHGIINVLTCAMWSGAICEFLPVFDAAAVWERLASGNLTLFMAVPTIYARLIQYWEGVAPAEQARLSAGCRQLRLMVSGSAALPVSRLERWREISGHTLLERYGMTELGMVLSNPLQGERKPGYVGQPLPNVVVRVVDEEHREVVPGASGELQVRGPNVFMEYWRRPDATAAAFVEGWFRTGDIVAIENDTFRILGRDSVDIIKTGGYKVSALEIEEILRTHPAVQDCAVVGVPDEVWGERVSAAVTLLPSQTLTLSDLRTWGKERLALYKVPSQLKVIEELPRNVLGKVTKPSVVRLFETI